MAIYNLADPLQKQSAELRFKKLSDSGKVIEMTDKSSSRTLSQNNYLHLLLQYAAIQLGEHSVTYVKQIYYKLESNRNLFFYTEYDNNMKREVPRLRSSRDLTTEEMSLSIQAFKNWCATVPAEPFVLPEATNPDEIAAAQAEVYRNQKYLIN